MVDPDNRQPVDFACRRRMLSALEPLLDAVCDMHMTPLREQVIDDRVRATGRLLASMLEQWPDGRVKLFTMAAALRFRRAHPSLFLTGDYEELGSDAHDPHLVSFSRRDAEREVVVVVPRFVATLLNGAPVLPFGMEHWRAASVPLAPAAGRGPSRQHLYRGGRRTGGLPGRVVVTGGERLSKLAGRDVRGGLTPQRR